jgi:predicted XRE-type DNA-binding protein
MGYNVFEDMGFENPEEELMKSEIVSSLRRLIDEKHLTMEQVATHWSMDSSAVSELLRGHWGDYSITQLLRFANALGGTLRIIIDSRDVAPHEEAKTLVLTA